jgi:hypothetical protein
MESPMKKTLMLLLLSFQFSFAQEFKVDGNLKVTGKIDAQNQPITNVGNPIEGFDAVNLSTLSSLIGSDANYDYKVRYVVHSAMSFNSSTNSTLFMKFEEDFKTKYESSWYAEYESIISDGYKLYSTPTNNANGWWIFAKKIE